MSPSPRPGSILFVHGMYEAKRPAFVAARDRGLRVTVVGPEPPDWAAGLVDDYVAGGTDTPAELAATIDRLRGGRFDGVITFWDHGVLPAAEIATALGLPGSTPAAARLVRNKHAMRAAFARAGVPHPEFALVRGPEELVAAGERIGFPAVYKPAGGAGSVGVLPVTSAAELTEVARITRELLTPERDSFFGYWPGEFVYERFVAGREVSVEGVVARGELHVAGVTEKWATPDTFTEWRHAYPARLAAAERRTAVELAAAAVRAVGIDDCGVHAEVMLTADGGQVIEVNGRLGGDFITSHLVPLASGTDLIGAALDAALGRPVRLSAPRSDGACVRFLLADRPGTVLGWEGLDAARTAPGVTAVVASRQVGDRVELPPEGFFSSRLGHVVAHGRDTDEAVRRADAALAGVTCRVG